MTIPWGDPADAAVRVRYAVYASFGERGLPPSPATLAHELDLDRVLVDNALRSLHDAHAVVLNDAGDAIRMAHPFSAAPMGYVVTASGDRAWWGGCGWDSLGIGAALDEAVTVSTHCPYCRAALTFVASPSAPPSLDDAVVRIPWPAREWWDDVVATCSKIRTFCNAEHLEQWVESAPERDRGRAVALAQLWTLAQPWYGDRLDPGWSPRPKEEAQRLLDDVGLTGDFWSLR